MPQETKAHAQPGEGGEAPSLAGFAAELVDDQGRMDILEKAFDFRGDVVLTLVNGSTVEGYIFDRRRGTTPADSHLRLMAPSGEKVRVEYPAIRRIEFSSRDPAAGKSFETWVKKYIEKKLRGEAANIEAEKLD